MAEEAGRFSKARVEAFSDGVIAVIITVMALELKPPDDAEPGELVKLWPSFAIYFVSFAFIAIYWINHHQLLAEARRATGLLIWANNALLFCLSLAPFATAYVGRTHLAPAPTAIYGALQFFCGVAFTALFETVARQRADEPRVLADIKVRRRQNAIAMSLYALATLLALWSPASALALFVAVALAFVAPGLVAEHAERRAARRR